MKRCILTCFAPDGSPFQGKSFVIGPEGASIGRKSTNVISLNIPDENDKCKQVQDSAVSAEHARIEMDRSTGQFFIYDGTSSKPSTNGTWFRLSGPQQESAFYALEPGVEVLVVNIRFLVSESLTVSEKMLKDDGHHNGK